MLWQIRRGLASGRAAHTPASAGLDAATTAWVAAVVGAGGTVSGPRQTIVDTFIKALKAASLWTTLDRYWLFASEDAFGAKIDLVNQQTITPSGAGWAFSANNGYTGDGSSYGDTNVNLATFGGHFAQNSATIGGQIQTSRTSGANVYMFGVADGGFTTEVALAPLTAGTDQLSRMNALGGGTIATVGNARQSWLQTRTASSGAGAVTLYQNGTSVGTDTTTSVGLPSANLYVSALNFGGAFGGTFSTDQISCIFFGSGWSSTQVANFETAQNAMMTSIGINVH